MTQEIKQVLQDQKAIWQQETTALKDSLVDARKEMDSAKADSVGILQSSRSALSDLKEEQNLALEDSRAQSNAALFEARNTLKESQREYQEESKSVARDLFAGMNVAKKTMRRGQKAQRRDAKHSNRKVLAALKIGKKKRISELKQDSSRKKFRKKRNVQTARKQIKKQKRIRNLEKRQAVLRTSRSKIADRKKTEKRKTERRKSQKRSIVRKKKSVVREKKVERRLAVKAASDLRSSQDKQNKINEETLKSLDREFDKEIDVPEIKETEKKPEQGKVVEEEAEVVVASLPNTPVKSSEETPQAKLSRFSKNISGLKNNLKNNGGNPGTLLAKLGEDYLEAQRFMDSQMDDEEKQNLLDLSENGDLVLGSYEQAAWAYKLALDCNHRSAGTHLKIGKIYDEMKDGQNALMYAKLAHQIFKRNHNSSQMKETQSFIDLLTTKYKNQSEKKWCTKDNISFIVGVTISTGSINIIDLEV